MMVQQKRKETVSRMDLRMNFSRSVDLWSFLKAFVMLELTNLTAPTLSHLSWCFVEENPRGLLSQFIKGKLSPFYR